MQDLIPLREAAAHVLARLVPAQVAASPGASGSLDLIAAAVCAMVPVYAQDASGELRRASEAEIARRASGLLVTRSDAETAAQKLVAKYVGCKPSAPPPAAAPQARGRLR